MECLSTHSSSGQSCRGRAQASAGTAWSWHGAAPEAGEDRTPCRVVGGRAHRAKAGPPLPWNVLEPYAVSPPVPARPGHSACPHSPGPVWLPAEGRGHRSVSPRHRSTLEQGFYLRTFMPSPCRWSLPTRCSHILPCSSTNAAWGSSQSEERARWTLSTPPQGVLAPH